MRLRRLATDLWSSTRVGINVYLIRRGRTLTLIDSGTPDMAAPILRAVAAEPSLAGATLGDVVLTHVHYDHAGGAAAVARATGATVWLHPEDAPLARAGAWRRPARPSPTWHGRALTALVAARYPERLPPLLDASPIGDVLPIAGGIDVLPTPGHCAGQVALAWTGEDGNRTVFAGDAIVNACGPREPILYEDRDEGLRSIAALASFARGADRIVPGHGRAIRVSPARLRRIAALAG